MRSLGEYGEHAPGPGKESKDARMQDTTF